MRLGTTITMIAAVLLLAAAIIGVDYFFPSTADAEKMSRTPLEFKPAQVDRIEITLKESRVMLARQDGLWRSLEPFEDLADAELITKLLVALKDIGWAAPLGKDELEGKTWERSGLAEPSAHVKLGGSGEVIGEAWFGNAAALEGMVYAAVQTPEVPRTERLAHTEVSAFFKRPAEDWRDPRLLRFPPDRVTRIVLANGSGQIEVARKDPKAPWMLVKPLQTRGHNTHIEALLATLLNIKVAVSAGTPDKTAAIPAAPGEEMEITLEIAGAAAPLVARLKKPVEKNAGTEATVSNRKAAFTASSDALDTLWVQPNDLRNDRLASIDIDAVQEIRIESITHSPVILEKKEGAWYLQRHGKAEPANTERATILLEALTQHRIREFTSDSASNLEAYGLQKPFLSLTWVTTDRKTSRMSFGVDAQQNVSAKHENEPFVYRVAANVIAAFPADPVKWKGLRPVSFSIFSLRRITTALGTAPPLVLDYNTDTAQWSGVLAGRDITPMIDRVMADRLADGLSRLTVQDWAQDRAEALQALKVPEITVQIDLTAPARPLIVRFAPTQAGAKTAVLYGMVNDGPDVFFVTRASLLELLGVPVLKAKP